MFRKLFDQGQAGDNVGILLRGTKREEVERGQVLCKPGSIKPHTHFTGEVYVLSKDEGGRHTVLQQLPSPVLLPYHGRDRAIELPEGKEMVMPGDNVSITVKLIPPSPWKKVCASHPRRWSYRGCGRGCQRSSPKTL